MKPRAKKPSDVLLPIQSAPKRPRIVVYDIESKDGTSDRKGFSRAFLVGLWDGQDYQAFRNFDHVRSLSRAIEPGGCVDLFMREILGRRDRKDPTKIHGGRPELASPTSVLYAHNGGRFDSTFLLTWLRRHSSEFEFSVVSVASAAQLIAVRRRRASPRSKEKRPTWRFVDSAKILPMSLKQAAELFCAGNAEVQKQADFDLDTPEDDPAWEHYNRLDCIALEAALGSFRDLVEGLGGELGVTAPSTSMRLFRRAFLDERGFQRHRHFPSCAASPFVCESSEKKRGLDGHDACLHDWIRRGYHGGRTEIFRMVAPPGVRYYDLNSSYPASMLEPMPVGDCKEVGPDEWHHVHKRLAQTHVGFVECTVHVPPTCYVPPLPYHDTKLDKLVFPTGTFSGVFSWAELELLPEVGGAIVGPIVRSVWFEARPVFRPFVESLYRFRDKKDKAYSVALSELAKLMLNSHYGKYGMKPDREELVVIEGGVDRFPENGKPLCGDHLHDDCWVVPKVIDAPYMIPQVAAHITSLSRIKVWRALQVAHELGGRVFYSDSVTEDRTTIVKDPKGRIRVLSFRGLWEERTRGEHRMEGPKQVASLVGWKALAKRADDGEEGWFPIEAIIRHKSKKTTSRISTKDGQTQVTRDHGIMRREGGRLVASTPDDFIGRGGGFVSVRAPKEPPLERVDLLDFLPGPCALTFGKAFVASADFDFLVLEGHRQRIRRFYDRGSPELAALLRLVGIYVGDGSASISGVTNECNRTNLSFCKARLETMEQVKSDLQTIAPGLEPWGPAWSETVYIVRTPQAPLTALFASLCGVKCYGKRLPSFCFALDEVGYAALKKGLDQADGQKERKREGVQIVGGKRRVCRYRGTETQYTTNSQELAAGISFLYDQHDQEHMIHFRPSKKAWVLRTRPAGSRRNRQKITQEVFVDDGGYVYDLSVPGAQTFVDGIGRVLLHNTDSILVDRPDGSWPDWWQRFEAAIGVGDKLGQWKREHPGWVLSAQFVLPKSYMLRNEAGSETVVKLKGISRSARTPENFARVVAGETVEFQRVTQHRTVLKSGAYGPLEVTAKKRITSVYDKRQVLANGNTAPLVLGE